MALFKKKKKGVYGRKPVLHQMALTTVTPILRVHSFERRKFTALRTLCTTAAGPCRISQAMRRVMIVMKMRRV